MVSFRFAKRRGLAALLIAAAALLAAPGAAFAAPGVATPFTEGQVAAIAREGDAVVKSLMEAKKFSAAAVVLVDPAGVVWQGTYGTLKEGTGREVTANSLFGLCSVSKMFAAVSVMKLADRGVVSLDAPVTRYIPDFRMEDPRYRDITVRMLLNHSSGLPGQTIIGGMTVGGAFPGYAEMVLKAQSLQALKFEPGFTAVYTNDAFSILEVLVRRVSGLPFTEFVDREILGPLGMKDSRFVTAPLPESTYAEPRADGEYSPDAILNVYGTGGLFSSAADMARFAGSFLADDGLLTASAIREMGEDQTKGLLFPVPADAFRFGLGWDTMRQPGMAAVGVKGWQKGGDLGFYGATMVVLPDERLAAVVLGATGFSSSDANHIAEAVLLRALVERGRLAHMPGAAAWAAAKAPAPDLREKATATGYYVGMPLSLYRASFSTEGALTVETKAGDAWVPAHESLEKRVDGWYSRDGYPVSMRFVAEGGFSFLALRYPTGAGHYLATLPLAQKADAAPPVPEAWTARLGEEWLLASDITDADDVLAPDMPVLTPEASADLPGYILAEALDGPQLMKPVDGDVAAMWMVTPVAMGRDQKDLRAETIGGVEYLRFGAERYRRAATVAEAGRGTVKLAAPGIAPGIALGEWRRLPPAGSLAVKGAALWRLYDGAFKSVASGHSDGSTRWANEGGAQSWLVVYPASTEGATVEIGD